jgi:hypothetical protein
MMIQFYTLATGKSTPSSDTPLSPHHLYAKFSPVSFSASWNVLSVMVATRWSNAWQTLRASMDKLCLEGRTKKNSFFVRQTFGVTIQNSDSYRWKSAGSHKDKTYKCSPFLLFFCSDIL